MVTDIWRFIGVPPSQLSALYFLIIFGECYYNSAYYLKGGYHKLFDALVEKIRENGSAVRLNAKVTSIITNGGRKIESVIIDEKEKVYTKVVISSADCFSTLTSLLDDGILKAGYHKKLATSEKSVSGIQVYLGLDCPAKLLGMDQPFLSLNSSYDHDLHMEYVFKEDYKKCALLITDHSQIDPTLAPAGKGTLLIMGFDTYAHWMDLSKDQYQEKKKEVARAFIERAEKYIPGVGSHVEVVEVATPKTFLRYANLPDGAIYGLAQTVPQSSVNRLGQKTKIKGLFLAGAWTHPGAGVHGCCLSGINAAEYALKVLAKS